MASAMPVFPEVESMIVLPGTSRPHARPSSIILSAGRSFTEPPGLNPSSFAHMLTPGATPSRTWRISTSGVLPTRLATERAASGPSVGAVGRARAASDVIVPPLGASRDRRDDRHLVARLDGRVELLQEADVLAVHEEVHEAPDLALLVADS